MLTPRPKNSFILILPYLWTPGTKGLKVQKFVIPTSVDTKVKEFIHFNSVIPEDIVNNWIERHKGNQYLRDISSWACDNPNYSNTWHGHTIKGDLQIIANTNLIKIIKDGSNVSKLKKCSWNHKVIIKEGLEDPHQNLTWTLKLISVATLTAHPLFPWNPVSKKAKKKIKTLTCTIKPSRSNPITNHKEVRLFKRIQNKFVPAFIYKELATLSWFVRNINLAWQWELNYFGRTIFVLKRRKTNILLIAFIKIKVRQSCNKALSE